MFSGTNNVLLDMDDEINEIVHNSVPQKWKRVSFLSTSHLNVYIDDLSERVAFLEVLSDELLECPFAT